MRSPPSPRGRTRRCSTPAALSTLPRARPFRISWSWPSLKKEGKLGKLLVTGCLSQRYQDELMEELPEVDGVMGTGSYTEIVPALES